jgi:hypothetical protein
MLLGVFHNFERFRFLKTCAPLFARESDLKTERYGAIVNPNPIEPNCFYREDVSEVMWVLVATRWLVSPNFSFFFLPI